MEISAADSRKDAIWDTAAVFRCNLCNPAHVTLFNQSDSSDLVTRELQLQCIALNTPLCLMHGLSERLGVDQGCLLLPPGVWLLCSFVYLRVPQTSAEHQFCLL